MSGAAPVVHRTPVRFAALMFGACAAPLFWLGQLMLGYWVSAVACYGSDRPTTIATGASLRSALIVFDAVAIVVALAGGIVAFICWRRVGSLDTGRSRFLAIWGILSSLWFLGAIVFNTIASIGVPLCVR